MNSIRTLTVSAAGLATAITIWASAGAAPAPTPGSDAERYEVTITNVTKGQIFAPALVVTHDGTFSLFELGEPASMELAHLAEEGDPGLLAAAAKADSGTLYTNTSGGLLMPGDSTTVVIAADTYHPYISVAGMLVSTNDGFFAIRDAMTPLGTSRQLARVYDAGSEFNSEDCMFIPGPPCGMGGSHDPAPAEGDVRVHEGIHGIGGLAPAMFDWRGGAAEITIKRMGS